MRVRGHLFSSLSNNDPQPQRAEPGSRGKWYLSFVSIPGAAVGGLRLEVLLRIHNEEIEDDKMEAFELGFSFY